MATLIKQREGILYDEDFSTNSLLWSLTPSNVDCLRFENDGLHILHNDQYVMYTMTEPLEQSYCVIVELEHKPLTTEDIAGIIIFSNTQDYAECQTYLATGPSKIDNHGRNIDYDLGEKYVEYKYIGEEDNSTGDDDNEQSPVEFVDTIYKYIKIIKHQHSTKSIYEFFASADGIEWIDVGNVDYYQNNTIGFFLYSTTDQRLLNHGKFVIKSFKIYEDKYIQLNNINMLYDFEVYEKVLADPNNNQELVKHTIFRSDETLLGENIVNRDGNNARIDTGPLMLPLKDVWLRIYQKNSYDITLYDYYLGHNTIGGDIFEINYDIKLFIDNQEVEKGLLHDLNTLFVSSFRKNIVVYNNEDIILRNIKISIAAYSEYYSGEEVVKIALYNQEDNDENEQYVDDNNHEFVYNSYVIIDSLDPHTGQELILKLSDVPEQDFYAVANDYRFKLLIE